MDNSPREKYVRKLNQIQSILQKLDDQDLGDIPIPRIAVVGAQVRLQLYASTII